MAYNLSNPAAIHEAAKQATHRANIEPNQNSYNAGWLHGYARALADVGSEIPDHEYFAVVRWMTEDVQAIRPDWTEKQCFDWWKNHERRFADTLTEYGNEMLSILLEEE